MFGKTPRSGENSGPIRWAALALLSCGALVLYALTRSGAHTWDAIAYTARIYGDELLTDRFLSTTFFHPHHLLFNVLGRGFLWVWRAVPAGTNDPFVPLQVMSALFGAACVFLTGAIVLRRTGRWPLAAFLAGVFALSHMVWRFSAEVEVMVPALFFGLLGVYILIGSPASHRRTLVAAVFLSVSVLLHQIHVFLCLASLLWVALSVKSGRSTLTQGFALGAYLVFFVLGTYVMIAMTSEQLRSPAEFWHWTTLVGSRSGFEFSTAFASVGISVKSFVHGVIGGYGLSRLRWDALTPSQVILASVSLYVLAGMLVGAASIILTARACFREARPFYIFNITWILSTAIFIAWFSPYNVEFWIYSIPPVLFVFAEGYKGSRIFAAPMRRFAVPLALAFLVSLGVANYRTSIAHYRSEASAEYHQAVTFVNEHMRRGDLIISGPEAVSALGRMAILAVPFFTGVDVRSAEESGGPLAKRIDDVLARGGRVYITAEALDTGLSSLWDAYRFEEFARLNDTPIYRIIPPGGGS